MNELNDSQWSLALDLLIARAALDEELRSQLMNDTTGTLLANGVEVPDDIHVVINHPDKRCVVREIPSTNADTHFEKTGETVRTREPVVYNGTNEYTETNTTTVAEAELTEAEAQTTTTTTTAEAEVEVVVVLI